MKQKNPSENINKIKQKQQNQQMQQNQQIEHQKKMEAQETEIENLNKNLVKKLYRDLFMANADLYLKKNLTFENYLFYFYKDILGMIDYSNPNYNQLYQKLDLKIKAYFEAQNKITPDLNRNEVAKELNKLSQEDEWALISKYQVEKYKQQQLNEIKQKREKTEKYLKELHQQISDKNNYKDKQSELKDNIYTYDDKMQTDKLQKLKVENQIKIDNLRRNNFNSNYINDSALNQIEDSNLSLTQDNKDLISFKIRFLENLENEDENIRSQLVDQIINEKKIEKIENILKATKYKNDLRKQLDDKIKNTERPNQMSAEEIKINKELLKESREFLGKLNKI